MSKSIRYATERQFVQALEDAADAVNRMQDGPKVTLKAGTLRIERFPSDAAEPFDPGLHTEIVISRGSFSGKVQIRASGYLEDIQQVLGVVREHVWGNDLG